MASNQDSLSWWHSFPSLAVENILNWKIPSKLFPIVQSLIWNDHRDSGLDVQVLMLFAMIVSTLPCKAWKLENQSWTKRTGPQTSCLAGIFQRDEGGDGGITVNNFRPSCTYEVAYTAALPVHQRARSHKVRMGFMDCASKSSILCH